MAKHIPLKLFVFAILLFASSLLMLSCDAPHDNPLDPESSYFNDSKYSLEDFAGHVRSLHTTQIFPTTDVYSVVVEAWTYENLEIDSVWVVYKDKNPVELEQIDFGMWGVPFAYSYFNSQDPRLIGVLGQPFVISFAVTNDEIYQLEPLTMIRLIEDSPEVVSPASGDTVTQNPVLNWNEFSAPFDFWYQASISRDEIGFEAEAWRSEVLPDTVFEIQCDETLVNGNYYWVIYVIDEFSNRSRSREGEFMVMMEAR